MWCCELALKKFIGAISISCRLQMYVLLKPQSINILKAEYGDRNQRDVVLVVIFALSHWVADFALRPAHEAPGGFRQETCPAQAQLAGGKKKQHLLLQCLTVVIKCTDTSKVLFLGEICPFTSFNLQGVYTSLIAPLRTFWSLVWLTFQVTARGKTVKEIPDTKRKCLFWCLEYHLSFVLHFGFMHL